jgi:hypothetical protein
MALILTDVGAQQILKKYFKNQSPAGGNNLRLKLFTNDITVSDGTVTTDLTEATGGGYAEATLATTDGTISVVSGIAQIAYPQSQFVFTGALTSAPTIYGYYIVDADNNLIFVERAPVGYTPLSNGDMYAVTPIIQLSKGVPS